MTPADASDPRSGESAFQRLAEEVDRAIAAADRLDGDARDTARQLRAALERFHKMGLTAIVTRLKADPHGRDLLYELVDEPEVRALLSLHGLIRLPPDDGEGAPPMAPPPPVPAPIAAVIPLAALKARPAAGWMQGPALADVDEGRPFRLDVRDTSLVLIRTGDRVQAFRNECAHQGLPIDGGRIDSESGTLTCPWHGFRFDCLTGECLTAPHVQLEAVPVRVERGVVQVRLD